jgi:hypothetical protein
MKVFWSWQSDTPAEVGMNFIKSAISDALSAIHVDLQLSEANRPGLDHDTKDTVGWAEVVNTIFSKIQNSSVFVADATPTLRSVSGKYSLNPNVLIELGYALRAWVLSALYWSGIPPAEDGPKTCPSISATALPQSSIASTRKPTQASARRQ